MLLKQPNGLCHMRGRHRAKSLLQSVHWVLLLLLQNLKVKRARRLLVQGMLLILHGRGGHGGGLCWHGQAPCHAAFPCPCRCVDGRRDGRAGSFACGLVAGRAGFAHSARAWALVGVVLVWARVALEHLPTAATAVRASLEPAARCEGGRGLAAA